jgi:Cu-Zn family superoxide dismutase
MNNPFTLGAGLLLAYDIFLNGDYPPSHVTAVTVFEKDIQGTVYFTEEDYNKVRVDIKLTGLPSNASLGFHIHQAGDLTEGCVSACAHLNPYNKSHGGRDSRVRHVGDLGNIQTDANGQCVMSFTDSMIKLRGFRQNIIGRSVVIHEKKDDLGLGGDAESLKTGNAGKRIACAVIGYSKKMC